MSDVDQQLVKAIVAAIEPMVVKVVQREIGVLSERLDRVEKRISALEESLVSLRTEFEQFRSETRSRFDMVDQELDGLVKRSVDIRKAVQKLGENQAKI